MTTRGAVLATAKAELGYTETPRNKTKYGKALGVNGQPWCAAYVWWVFKQVGIDLRAYCDNVAYTPNLYADLKARGWAIDERDAKAGDIVFFDFPDHVHRIQHVGLVVENHHPTFITIEGNTSGRNQSNGGQVQQRTRSAGVIVGVIRLPFLGDAPVAQPAAPPPPPSPAAVAATTPLVDAIRFCKHALVGEGHVTSGPAVSFVQQGINNLHVAGLNLVVDGQWGTHTADAVRWVQATHGLVADAVVGPATWNLLYPGV